MAQDFARFQGEADKHEDEYFREKYALWREAFEMAAESLTTLTNPFQKDRVRKIDIEIYPEARYGSGKRIEATIWFQSGNTSGHHKVFADTLDELMDVVSKELESL